MREGIFFTVKEAEELWDIATASSDKAKFIENCADKNLLLFTASDYAKTMYESYALTASHKSLPDAAKITMEALYKSVVFIEHCYKRDLKKLEDTK